MFVFPYTAPSQSRPRCCKSRSSSTFMVVKSFPYLHDDLVIADLPLRLVYPELTYRWSALVPSQCRLPLQDDVLSSEMMYPECLQTMATSGLPKIKPCRGSTLVLAVLLSFYFLGQLCSSFDECFCTRNLALDDASNDCASGALAWHTASMRPCYSCRVEQGEP
jgi:hypothetical protein